MEVAYGEGGKGLGNVPEGAGLSAAFTPDLSSPS